MRHLQAHQILMAVPLVDRSALTESDLETLYTAYNEARAIVTESILGNFNAIRQSLLDHDGPGTPWDEGGPFPSLFGGGDATPEDVEAIEAAEWANTYHTRFRNFHTRTLEATKELFRARPSQLTPEERHQVFTTWVNEISNTYGMEAPPILWDDDADLGGGGFYNPEAHTITLSPNRRSVITLLHETRHAMQHAEKGAPAISDDIERDARAWSLSLFYKVNPNLFTRLVRERRVLHINPYIFDTENNELPSTGAGNR
jgi:hypothetical protein